MFRILRRGLTTLCTLIVMVGVVDFYLRGAYSQEITAEQLNDEEAEFLDRLITQNGEGFSVYNNEGNSGFLIVSTFGQGVLDWLNGR